MMKPITQPDSTFTLDQILPNLREVLPLQKLKAQIFLPAPSS